MEKGGCYDFFEGVIRPVRESVAKLRERFFGTQYPTISITLVETTTLKLHDLFAVSFLPVDPLDPLILVHREKLGIRHIELNPLGIRAEESCVDIVPRCLGDRPETTPRVFNLNGVDYVNEKDIGSVPRDKLRGPDRSRRGEFPETIKLGLDLFLRADKI